MNMKISKVLKSIKPVLAWSILVPCLWGGSVVHATSADKMTVDQPTESEIGQYVYKMIDDSFKLMKEQDYAEMSNFFRFPEGNSDAETVRDRCFIASSLKYLTHRFGKPSDIKPPENGKQIQHYSIYVQAGSVEYWKKKQTSASTSFLVNFANVGPGVINFQFDGLDKDMKLRSMAYGFEVSAEAKAKLMVLGREYTQFVKKISPKCNEMKN